MLTRPRFHLSHLPLRYRWEATRRHPLYLQLWKIRQAAGDRWHRIKNDVWLGAARQALGISGDPEDPSLEFDELAKEAIPPQWLRGAIQPVSVRSLAMALVSTLPRPLLNELGKCFDAASEGSDDEEARHRAVYRISRADMEQMDHLLDAPFFIISPVAPREQLMADLSEIRKEWRKRHGQPDRRSRSADYGKYLQVWDLREGWSGGEYDATAELTLKDISRKLRRPVSTASDQYASAFHLIAGHRHSPENWFLLMGVKKFSALCSGSGGLASLRRLRQSRTEESVDDATVSGSSVNHSVVDAESTDSGDQWLCDLLNDINTLISKGRTDEEIIAELELAEAALPAVESIRRREEMR